MADQASGSATSASLEIARRALARAGANGGAHSVEVLQRGCDLVTENLRESLGEAGCTALLARALTRMEPVYPVLREVRRLEHGGIELTGIAASVEAHGLPAVTAAIEALLAALLEILTQLIGADMAARLIDDDRRAPGAPEGDHTP